MTDPITIPSGIHIADTATFEQKLALLRQGGKANLHVVSDFDHTMTRRGGDRTTAATSWSIYEGGLLSPAYDAQSAILLAKYLPMESDPGLSLEERTAAMVEWWMHHTVLLQNERITACITSRALQKGHIQLRERMPELLLHCSLHRIPFLVFSAGVGDAIQLFLESQGLLTSNLHLIANFFEFDDAGNMTGFKHDTVHCLNKNSSHVRDESYAAHIVARQNVILLGDNLRDANMTDGMPTGTILRIGFLNGDQHRLSQFAEVYDAVILEDGNMGFVHDLLLSI